MKKNNGVLRNKVQHLFIIRDICVGIKIYKELQGYD